MLLSRFPLPRYFPVLALAISTIFVINGCQGILPTPTDTPVPTQSLTATSTPTPTPVPTTIPYIFRSSPAS